MVIIASFKKPVIFQIFIVNVAIFFLTEGSPTNEHRILINEAMTRRTSSFGSMVSHYIELIRPDDSKEISLDGNTIRKSKLI